MRKRNTYYDDLISGNILQVLKITKLQKNAFKNMQNLKENWADKTKFPEIWQMIERLGFLKNFKI